ncbi:SDR family oxidoreductase [Sphingobium sufflavum]|uniref:SDR family NAD(P)-dependent oxidoreductase n=1 Tax=Sphingobium sufflavum TaxID=1129547 RepID=UPI001F32D676|nr:SDR family oxidoreductase [Sphingobium sufflavum]MCE7797949.1 SDR family oxidoreductase [Sphingobium sufflavum]
MSGRVAIVTGGGTGIGRATALLLTQMGADVAIASRSAAPLGEAAKAIADATGRRCIAVPTDVREEEQVVALVEACVARLGRVDILVNNAGGTRMIPLTEISTKLWERSFDLNATAAYFATREVGRHFITQKSGVIVNISSMAGVHGVKGGAHYAASKAALQMFTRVTAAEWGRYGIRCNCVAPGMIATELARAAWDEAGIDMAAGVPSVPLCRAGTPEEVAAAIVFLASDAASYISGETLAVAGGPDMGGIADL